MTTIATDILKSIKNIETLDLNNLTYVEALSLGTAIDRLAFTWEVRKLRAKSELLLTSEFIKLFTLVTANYQDLIPLKATLKDKKGIYILSFSNGKYYVGQTNNMCRRLDEYFDINKREYKGHNNEIKELFRTDPDLVTEIYFLEADSNLNLLESTYIEKLKANDPTYGYNKTGGNQ
jgi:hypothetical protein